MSDVPIVPDDEIRPPYLLCGLIAGSALLSCAGFFWSGADHAEQLQLTAAAVSKQAKDLTQVIELKQVYSKPAAQEDPATYRTHDPTRQKTPSDTPVRPLRSL